MEDRQFTIPSFDSFDPKAAKRFMEETFAKYRMCKVMRYAVREAAVTMKYEAKEHGATNRVGDPTGSIAAHNADKANECLAFCEVIESLVDQLEPDEQLLIRERYMKGRASRTRTCTASPSIRRSAQSRTAISASGRSRSCCTRSSMYSRVMADKGVQWKSTTINKPGPPGFPGRPGLSFMEAYFLLSFGYICSRKPLISSLSRYSSNVVTRSMMPFGVISTMRFAIVCTN